MIVTSNRENWFQELVDDCQGILVEGFTNYNWSLIQVYHAVGERIVVEEENFKKNNQNPISAVAVALGRSERTIQRCVQFFKKYPDLTLLPEGKTYEENGKVKYVSWHLIVNKYLPETVTSREREVLPEVTIKAKDLHDWAFKVWSIKVDLKKLNLIGADGSVASNMEMWLTDLEEAMRKPLEKTGFDPSKRGSD